MASNIAGVAWDIDQSFTIPLFTEVNPGLPSIEGWVAWGDYDDDGWLDVMLTGSIANGSPAPRVSQIWRNTGGAFTSATTNLSTLDFTSAAWGDYDNDGRLDALFAGAGGGNGFSQLWRNNGSEFTNRFGPNSGMSGGGEAVWGDYDNDGRLDIVFSGGPVLQRNTGRYGPNFFPSNSISQVWRNTGAGFSNINAGLPGVSLGTARWADYDNDGRLDILLTGTNNAVGLISQVWRNTGNGFSNINAGLTAVWQGLSAWGDYDNDGRIDILMTGLAAGHVPITRIWRNNTAVANSPPNVPAELHVAVSNSVAFLSWNAATDSQTPAAGLSYNVRIGTAPGGSDVVTPMSGASGARHLPALGNAQSKVFLRFNYREDTPYYFSVQAVDGAFAGSPFASERSFRILQPAVVSATSSNVVSGDLNGDGTVNQSELDVVLANYLSNSPWLQMTNVAGLGGSNVTFTLTNSLAGALDVQVTTNLVDWDLLGPAIPRFGFTDTNAPGGPQRYYRLRVNEN